MRIEQDIKLDFKDVLIRPKRSTLTSRSEVDIARSYEFLHSKKKYHGIPIIAANMDTTGTMEMARALAARRRTSPAACEAWLALPWPRYSGLALVYSLAWPLG